MPHKQRITTACTYVKHYPAQSLQAVPASVAHEGETGQDVWTNPRLVTQTSNPPRVLTDRGKLFLTTREQSYKDEMSEIGGLTLCEQGTDPSATTYRQFAEPYAPLRIPVNEPGPTVRVDCLPVSAGLAGTIIMTGLTVNNNCDPPATEMSLSRTAFGILLPDPGSLPATLPPKGTGNYEFGGIRQTLMEVYGGPWDCPGTSQNAQDVAPLCGVTTTSSNMGVIGSVFYKYTNLLLTNRTTYLLTVQIKEARVCAWNRGVTAVCGFGSATNSGPVCAQIPFGIGNFLDVRINVGANSFSWAVAEFLGIDPNRGYENCNIPNPVNGELPDVNNETTVPVINCGSEGFFPRTDHPTFDGYPDDPDNPTTEPRNHTCCRTDDPNLAPPIPGDPACA